MKLLPLLSYSKPAIVKERCFWQNCHPAVIILASFGCSSEVVLLWALGILVVALA